MFSGNRSWIVCDRYLNKVTISVTIKNNLAVGSDLLYLLYTKKACNLYVLKTSFVRTSTEILLTNILYIFQAELCCHSLFHLHIPIDMMFNCMGARILLPHLLLVSDFPCNNIH